MDTHYTFTKIDMKTLAWAEISLTAAQHNFGIVKQAAPSSMIMAVIKANAYGHGAVKIALALTKTNAFAVARIDEAIELRQHSISKPIVILSGAITTDDFIACIDYHLEPVIHSLAQCQTLINTAKQAVSVWLKVDTGMHRLGINAGDMEKALLLLKDNEHIKVVGVMSHLANAELINSSTNIQQQGLFEKLSCRHHLNTRSLANSASILFQPSMHYEWVRPGIMLYGSNPAEQNNAFTQQLKPVMTLKSRIIAIKTINSGEKVGYNGKWQAATDSRIATIAIGYADGYPRHAENGTPVLINGKTYPLAGRVSMDLITVDVSAGNVNVGDEVTLWGEGLPANLIAQHAQTISYDLFTGVTQRVKINYI